RYSAAIVIRIDEGGSVDAIAPLPTDGERGIGFLNVDRFAVAVSSQSCREPVAWVEQPGIAGFGGEQDQLADGHDTALLMGRLTPNIPPLSAQTKFPAPDDLLAGSAPVSFATLDVSWGGLPWNYSPSCSATCWRSSMLPPTPDGRTVATKLG